MYSYCCLVVLLIILPSSIHAIAIDNGLQEEPEVECSSERVEMQFRTQKPFRGKIFVKGHFNELDCRRDYSGGSTGDRPTAGIVIPHGSCDMSRQRTLNPVGMQFSAIVVISFHPTFITKVDRAFHVKCMYREMEKTVTSGLTVSMLTTVVLDRSFPMPTCTYTIRKDEIDGEILKYARVGEQVVHRWECQSGFADYFFADYVYGILVHSCYITDGQGEKEAIIDEKGCHIDRYLLGDPTYTESLTMAYRESHVFKFADRVAVRFQCQLRLCMKDNDGCSGISPPVCNDPRGGSNVRQRPANLDPPGQSLEKVTSERLIHTTQNTLDAVTPQDNNNNDRRVTIVDRASSTPFSPFQTTSVENGIGDDLVTLPPNDDLLNRENKTFPSIETRQTEINRERLFRRRLFKRDAPHSPPSAASASQRLLDNTAVGPDGQELINGDFESQFIYVLDSTEIPDQEVAEEERDLERLIGSNGAIVGEIQAGICLSTVTFAFMAVSVFLVFILAASTVIVVFFCKLRPSGKADSLPTASSNSAIYSTYSS